MAQVEKSRRVGRLAAEIGRAWDLRHEAELKADAERAGRARQARVRTLEAAERGALARIRDLEAQLAAAEPCSSTDALALATLLLDRIDAVGDRDGEQMREQARKIALALVRYLGSEARTTPAALGMRAYCGASIVSPEAGGHA